MTKPVLVSEIFGPVIQGEGALAGVPTVFVRTGGCDYRCTWCDTLYSVLPRHRPSWERLTALEIVERVGQLRTMAVKPWVTLSGGNPAMWDLSDLVIQLQLAGHKVAIETQGSVWAAWAPLLDHITVSPKPPSSRETPDQAELQRWLHTNPGKVSLKVVVADERDLDFALRVHAGCPKGVRLYLQPCNPFTGDPGRVLGPHHKIQLLDAYARLCDAVLHHGVSDVVVLPQLHALMDGDANAKG